MSSELHVKAELRADKGKGASRRLRRTGRIPAILYGAGEDAVPLTVEHDPIVHQLDNEAFYASILEIEIDGKKEKAVLKDMQRHPYKPTVLHIDFMRVSASETLRLSIPLHLTGEESCPGVKKGGNVSQLLTEVEVSCLPRDLPEALTLDISGLDLDETLRLSDIELPKGVEIVELTHGEGHDQAVVSVHHAHVASEETEAGAEAESGEEPSETGEEG